MRFSKIALKVFFLLKTEGLSNAQFFKKYPNIDAVEESFDKNFDIDSKLIIKDLEQDGVDGFVCCYDEDFPKISSQIKGADRPVLLFYKGDISLLNSAYNVAVIGAVDPTDDVVKREKRIVDFIVKSNFNVVSGLAKGCDTVAHRVCVENGGKTIVILPTTIGNIYPAENRNLAKEIVAAGGLLITEYHENPDNRYKAIARFVERDRLQAMFSRGVILIASYRNGEGDSGSRHAMEKAKKYGKKRFIMYNANTDEDDARFGLNKDLLNNETDTLVLTQVALNDFFADKSSASEDDLNYQQMKLF